MMDQEVSGRILKPRESPNLKDIFLQIHTHIKMWKIQADEQMYEFQG